MQIKMGSVTKARRAAEVLAENGVRASVIKATDSPEGCAYALSVNDRDAARAVALIESAGIKKSGGRK